MQQRSCLLRARAITPLTEYTDEDIIAQQKKRQKVSLQESMCWGEASGEGG